MNVYTMNIQVYVIWHNKLFSELYDELPKDDLNNLIMFGVNEKYEKILDTKKEYRVMYEYDLPMYNPTLQQHGYCQSTAMYHLYKNGTYKGVDYIGFIQYDMKVHADLFQHMREVLRIARAEGKEVIFHEQTEHISQSIQWTKCLVDPYEGSVLQHYNTFFGTNYSVNDLVASRAAHLVPIVHTFVISAAMFEKMMGWICSYMDHLESMHPAYPCDKSQAELLERCHGMFLALEAMQTTKVIHCPMKVKHVWPLYHKMTDFVNYKTVA